MSRKLILEGEGVPTPTREYIDKPKDPLASTEEALGVILEGVPYTAVQQRLLMDVLLEHFKTTSGQGRVRQLLRNLGHTHLPDRILIPTVIFFAGRLKEQGSAQPPGA